MHPFCATFQVAMEVGDPSFPRLLDALKAGVARAKDLKLNGRDATLCGEPLG